MHLIFMHIFLTIVLIFGAIVSLIAGLVGVLRDLIARGPYDAPLIDASIIKVDAPIIKVDAPTVKVDAPNIKDELAWPPRHQGAARTPSVSADMHNGSSASPR
jgi:hypothetical protein